MSSKLQDHIAVFYDEYIHEKTLTPETFNDIVIADASKREEKNIGNILSCNKESVSKRQLTDVVIKYYVY